MASERQITVGGVPIGGGAPVAVQTMTKTETANLDETLAQIHRAVEAGADLIRCAVPRDEDAKALATLVTESPIPIIADIHFNYTLAIKAIEAGAHCIRLNPGNIGGPDKVSQVADKARAAGVPMRIGVNSGSLPRHLHALEREKPVEALVTAAVEFVELMESLDFRDFKVSIKSTNVPNTIASNRLLAQRIPYPIHLGITEAGTKWSGSLKSAVGLGTLLADGVGDTIRISLSTFHAEEEVKVGWEILKALKLRERGPVLIACPTCGRLQFDMDTVVAEIEQRLEAYAEPVEVAVLGCAVNGIGEASSADFGITGAKNEGLIFAGGKPLRKVPQDRLVDALFEEIDRSLEQGTVDVDAGEAAEGAAWLERIEEENAGELTPERLAKLEAEAARAEDGDEAQAVIDALSGPGNAADDETDGGSGSPADEAERTPLPSADDAKERVRLDEQASPTTGRRFTRA
ncbi:MAG: flavodoxin-dependent (E)-4-hydroxy-3-methylbut-2-enyl-diphosphate synthase [Solirubrobacterales bacterium]